MINAMLVAIEFNEMLPVNMRPEFTEGYDGFYHLTHMEGTVENASLVYIVRDHDRKKFETKKSLAVETAKFINTKYGEEICKAELTDQYYNMREMVEPVYHVVETARQAMEAVGVVPKIQPIRGGTDGARLSFMGLPCPNIFAGGMNFHGKFEYVSLDVMNQATEVILKILEMYTNK